jgi:guanylate kinase
MIYVISGPSGCGKSTLIRRVLAELEGVCFSVSHTTREKREVEVDGRDYYFVSLDEFQRMIRRNAFIESAVVHGSLYGTSKRELKKGKRNDLLLDIDVQGARQIKTKVRTAVFVFVLPPSFAELKKRLESRRLDSAGAIRRRLAVAKKEVRAYSRFDYIVINGELERAVTDLKSIILCRRARLAARRLDIRPVLETFGKRG